jgi:hypothetical protein
VSTDKAGPYLRVLDELLLAPSLHDLGGVSGVEMRKAPVQ